MPANLNLILVGPALPQENKDNEDANLGGTVVSFKEIVDFVSPRVKSCKVISTLPSSGGRLIAAMRVCGGVVRNIRTADAVSVHLSRRGAQTIAPLIFLICRAMGKPFVFRQFGGDFHLAFEQLPAWHQKVLQLTIFRADAIFLQTKAMISAFAGFSDKLHWFPTARRRQACLLKQSFALGTSETLRCVFVGQVRQDKGILEAISAVRSLPQVTLDIYGPLIDVTRAELDSGQTRYCGVLRPGDVAQAMCDYDVLLFPTRYEGEGYAGVLVEAALVGLPIIASRWRSLPEMFAEDEAIFVDEGEVEELRAALRRVLDRPQLLANLSEKLRKRSVAFEAEHVFERFLSICATLK